MDSPYLSIIIPIYCGEKYIHNLFRTIKNQGLNKDDYELIFIDDASPSNPAKVFNEVISNHSDVNAVFYVHKDNKRQGGGRNTGIRRASGKYIIFLDQDDEFINGSLSKVKNFLIENDNLDLDILMYDTEGQPYKNNTKELMTGSEFIKTQEIPWCPWCYAYKTKYLKDNNIFFKEKVRFEDADFVIKATVNAAKIIFKPIEVVKHIEWDGQTSKIGNDPMRIKDFFDMSFRISAIGKSWLDKDRECARAIFNHHWFMHKNNIIRYLWRLKYNQTLQILKDYPAYTPSPNFLLNLSSKHPKLFAIGLQTIKPLLPMIRKLYLSSKTLL